MARISRLRGNQSLRRRPGQKPPRSITLIVCEGETERKYFEAARIRYQLTQAEVVLDDNTEGPAPISVVRCAEKKCAERGGYDHVFCVFDRDGHESFTRARDQVLALAARKHKPLPIKAIISVPCFELWVLLHFEKTDAPFVRCDEVVAAVRSHMQGYIKADSAIARQLMGRLSVALGNAEWLEQLAANNNYNPYTSVHHILRHFETVAQLEDGA